MKGKTIFDKLTVRYFIATVVVLWMGESILFHNTCPWWYWLAIELTAIMALFCFGIAERTYKWKSDFSFTRYPITCISGIAVIIAGFFSIWQLIHHFT